MTPEDSLWVESQLMHNRHSGIQTWSPGFLSFLEATLKPPHQQYFWPTWLGIAWPTKGPVCDLEGFVPWWIPKFWKRNSEADENGVFRCWGIPRCVFVAFWGLLGFLEFIFRNLWIHIPKLWNFLDIVRLPRSHHLDFLVSDWTGTLLHCCHFWPDDRDRCSVSTSKPLNIMSRFGWTTNCVHNPAVLYCCAF